MRFGKLAALGFAAWLLSTPAFADEQVKPILDSAEKLKPDAIKFWEQLVSIDSGTGDAQGINAVGAIAAEELKKLGASVDLVPNEHALAGDNIVATFTGTGQGKILLMAHMDTVFAKGSVAKRPFRIEGGRAYGPGVSDDKAGVVIGLTTLKILKELNFKDYARVTLLLNTNEETGSRGSRTLIERLAKEHDVTLNLEGGRAGDGITIWRKGSGTIKVEVKGRASHAGASPELGRNAVMELAHQVLQLSKLADETKGTTVNFTVVKGGDRKNVIPDYAEADADVRAVVSEEFDRVEHDLAATIKNKLIADTEVKATLTRTFPVMPQNAQIDALATMAQRIYGELGKTLALGGSGGAADSSLAAGVFKPTLDGLSMIGANPHTDREYAVVDSMVPRLYLLTRMVMELGRKP
ncbi:glutamate carboxypeptidase [Rhodoplanes sp. Z2-YC6860]|uniref:glutamate carboxypeptidase n=1 Tax=Rhodoplanes sp. Z2-YC6860 TaxID=674703 RepID=UPI00078E7661|nr:glutamate carboxypeptidase [Rhodoplanes sp. Z2-YC6860]AMN45434.1 carboxypeptidase G2 [Rhodoplanes sp. Z2-YC6860]